MFYWFTVANLHSKFSCTNIRQLLTDFVPSVYLSQIKPVQISSNITETSQIHRRCQGCQSAAFADPDPAAEKNTDPNARICVELLTSLPQDHDVGVRIDFRVQIRRRHSYGSAALTFSRENRPAGRTFLIFRAQDPGIFTNYYMSKK